MKTKLMFGFLTPIIIFLFSITNSSATSELLTIQYDPAFYSQFTPNSSTFNSNNLMAGIPSIEELNLSSGNISVYKPTSDDLPSSLIFSGGDVSFKFDLPLDSDNSATLTYTSQITNSGLSVYATNWNPMTGGAGTQYGNIILGPILPELTNSGRIDIRRQFS